MLTDDEDKFVKWYDYLWLLIPIAGITMMVATVLDRKKREQQ